jgi:hypothetical protein
MAKNDLKREGRSGLETVNVEDPNAQMVDEGSVQDADAAIFGSLRGIESGRLVAKPISIYEIFPDPKQPRRLLPGWLRYDRPIEDILNDWWAMANDEAGYAIPLAELLTGEETFRSQDIDTPDPRPIEAAFTKLVNLAATIRRDGGLINPVTVYKTGTVYQLETGERRWLAHHLLSFALVEERWQKISARLVDSPSIWRQAHENTARDDLNAISLARQLALLVMDIYMEKGVDFHPYEVFGHDRHFYAQVADGTSFPIPYGDAERVVAAMGVKSAMQVRHYRALLRLPDDIWQMGDDDNRKEGALREFLKEERETQTPVTVVTHLSSVQAQESEQAVESDEAAVTDDAEVAALPKPIAQVLYWAYRRTSPATYDAATWFSAQNVGSAPESLNRMIERGYLEGRKPATNTDRNLAHYRITPEGCRAIGEQPLDFSFMGDRQPTTPPVSESVARSGVTGQSIERERRTSPVKPLLQGHDRMLVEAALNATDARLDEHDGLQDAINTLGRSIRVQQQKLDELLLRQRA